MLATIRPTASADGASDVAPRMLTDRSCASRPERSDRTSEIVTTAADTT